MKLPRKSLVCPSRINWVQCLCLGALNTLTKEAKDWTTNFVYDLLYLLDPSLCFLQTSSHISSHFSLCHFGEGWPTGIYLLGAENSHGCLWSKLITHWTIGACNLIPIVTLRLSGNSPPSRRMDREEERTVETVLLCSLCNRIFCVLSSCQIQCFGVVLGFYVEILRVTSFLFY